MTDHDDSPVMWRPARPVSRVMTDREESLLKVLEEDPEAVKMAAHLVAANPELMEIAKALWKLGNLAVGDYFHLPRPPKGGKTGRWRDSRARTLEKVAMTAFIRKAVARLRTAIVKGSTPPELLELWEDRLGVPPVDVAGAVAWARAELEKERETRKSCGPLVELHTPKQWAARAYLRATGAGDAWRSADTLLTRIEVAPGRPFKL